MPQVSEVAENIYLIDAEAAFLSEWLSAYLINEEIKVLIEVGSPAAKETLLNGIRQIGVNPGDISYIIVTHIHIDHAGGAGVLVKEMPQAKVLVHPRGGKHLIEPSKLVNSTLQVQGKVVTERYGSVMPLDPERVQLAEDNQVIPLGAKQKLRIIYTPGHAPHHLSVYEERNRGVFTGEVAGLYFPGLEMVLPNTPPPNFDLEANIQSLEKVSNLSPEILYFSHSGATRKAAYYLGAAGDKLRMWAETIRKTMESYPEDTVDRLQDFIRAEAEPVIRKKLAYYELALRNFMILSVKGYIEYFKTKEAARS